MKEVNEAHSSLGKDLSEEKKRFLKSKAPKDPTRSQQQDVIEASEVLLRYFFIKASGGEVFGSVGRVERELGHSVREHYCIQDGVFAAAARTYWTFRLEAEDVGDSDDVMALVLGQVIMGVSWLFVPFPTFMAMPLTERIEEQRRYLLEYGPTIDIDSFVYENPLLEPEHRPWKGNGI